MSYSRQVEGVVRSRWSAPYSYREAIALRIRSTADAESAIQVGIGAAPKTVTRPLGQVGSMTVFPLASVPTNIERTDWC